MPRPERKKAPQVKLSPSEPVVDLVAVYAARKRLCGSRRELDPVLPELSLRAAPWHPWSL